MMPLKPNNWPEVREWRKSERRRLLALRAGMGREARSAAAASILPLVHEAIRGHGAQAVGLYWPIKSELDFRMLAESLNQDGIATALPVIIEKGAPLAYWQWSPGEPLERGFWNIPVPRQRRPIRPDAVLAPTVGFDRAGYRLGYGGGYFDRTLARNRTARPSPSASDSISPGWTRSGRSRTTSHWTWSSPSLAANRAGLHPDDHLVIGEGRQRVARGETPTTGAVSVSRQSLAKFSSACASCQ